MFKKFLKVAIAVSFFFTLQGLFAQDGARKIISYKEALRIYHSSSNDVKIARINKSISKRDASVASSWIPSISVSSALATGAKSFSNKTDWNWSDYPTLNANASFSLNASSFTKIFSSIVQGELSDFTYDSTIKNLDMALYNTYSSLIASIEAVNVAEKSFENAKQILDNTQARFDSGLVSSLELMNARLAYSKSESNCVSLRKTRNNVYITLKNMLGLDYDFDVEEMNELAFLDLPSASELYKKYLTTNSTLRQLDLTNRVTNNAFVTATTASLLPTFTAALSYTYDKNSVALGRDNNLSFALQGTLSLDGFIPGTSTWQNICNAKDRSDIAKLNLETGYSTFRKEIEGNIDNIILLEASYISALQQVEYASESYRLTKDAFDKGSVSMNTLSTSMETLLGAEVSLISANLNYKSAVYSFAVYLGDSFENFVKTYRRQ